MNAIITEGFVQQQLAARYVGLAHTYVVSNAQLYYPWEADLLSVTRTGKVVESEIKLSRADFKAEFVGKRTKHELLEAGDPLREEYRAVLYPPYPQPVVYAMVPPSSPIIPNYFRFVCPEGMITKEEVPPYAGLITFQVSDGSWNYRQDPPPPPIYYLTFKEVRRAPKIHDEPISPTQRDRLAEKLMRRYWATQNHR